MNGKQCLVIDDVDAVQKILDGMLEALGFAPVNASSGLEGLVCFEKHPTSLVMVDAEIRGRLRADEVTATIKNLSPETCIVLVTEGEVTRRTEEECRADIILHKPFGLGALQSALNPFSLS